MERASNTQKEADVDDDIEPELQRIKDEEDIHEQEAREPDIPVAALPPLPLEEKAAPIGESTFWFKISIHASHQVSGGLK